MRVGDLNGSGEQVVLNLGPAANPRGIALDVPGGRMFWADFDQSLIRRANVNGTQAVTIVALPPGTGPFGVDYVVSAYEVYWTEYNAGRIRRCNGDGANVTTLVSGLSNPTYLALDANGNRMYWIEAAAGGQRLRRANLDGSGVTTLPVPISTFGGLAFRSGLPVGLEPPAPVAEFALEPVAPNPASGAARITFALPHESRVRLSVLDVQGRELAVLVEGMKPAGRHSVAWRGETSSGGGVAAGLYFVRMRAAGREWTRRVALAP